MHTTRTFRLIFISLLIAQSLALFVFEGLIPLPFVVPGAKLGLANLITVIALYTLPSRRDVLLILAVRVLLATMFGGGPTIFLYSMSGALISFAAMCLLKETGWFSLLGVSAAGGSFHNLGQLLTAVLVLQTPGLWLYLPALAAVGIATGLLIGLAAHLTVRRLQRLPVFQQLTDDIQE